MKRLFLIILLLVPTVALAKGGGGGGGHASSGGGRSSASTSSRSTSGTTSKVAASAPKPAPAPAKPTASTATKTVSTPPKPGYKTTGSVVGSGGYSPRFRGYSAPAGSTVYYHNTSAWDWLPFLYIMHASDHQSATVVQPDGKKVEVQQDGVDGMLIFNWIMLILITLGIIVLIVWLVNKKTNGRGFQHATV